jgi:hypothetical protein
MKVATMLPSTRSQHIDVVIAHPDQSRSTIFIGSASSVSRDPPHLVATGPSMFGKGGGRHRQAAHVIEYNIPYVLLFFLETFEMFEYEISELDE